MVGMLKKSQTEIKLEVEFSLMQIKKLSSKR